MNNNTSVDASTTLANPTLNMADPNYYVGYTEFQQPSNVIWNGTIMIKSDVASIAMNYVAGNLEIAKSCLGQISRDLNNQAPIKILQRMRIEPSQMDGVRRKLSADSEHCILIGVPYGSSQIDQMTQTSSLRNVFINYLLEKRAAGIVNVAIPPSAEPSYVVHIFPPCEYTSDLLRSRKPDLYRRLGDYTHLFIVIATV